MKFDAAVRSLFFIKMLLEFVKFFTESHSPIPGYWTLHKQAIAFQTLSFVDCELCAQFSAVVVWPYGQCLEERIDLAF